MRQGGRRMKMHTPMTRELETTRSAPVERPCVVRGRCAERDSRFAV